jgi:hypothetical protein
MENMAIWGYLQYTKSFLIAGKVFKHIPRIRGKNLCVHGEDAKRLLAYSPNTPRDIKLSNEHISVNNGTKYKKFRFFLSILNGFESSKKPSHATVPLNSPLIFISQTEVTVWRGLISSLCTIERLLISSPPPKGH